MDQALPDTATWEPSFEEVFDLSLDLLCIAGLDGYLRRVNPALENAFGYPREQLLARPLLEFVHRDDRARAAAAVDRLGTGEEIFRLETRIIRGDGATLLLEWSARPVPSERVWYGTARDISARKDAEERLRQAQEVVERSRDELRRHVEEEAALRRVATLVARGVPQAEVLDAVAEEVRLLFSADIAAMVRYDGDGTATLLASRGRTAPNWGRGARIDLTGESIAAAVLRTGRPARIERSDDSTTWAPHVHELGIRTAVGAPVTVEGRLWGGMAVAWVDPRAPAAEGADRRIAAFTELVATAIANADGRRQLQVRSDEQAALRRVATLVARGVAPAAVLDAVAEEVGKLLGADSTRIVRYEQQGAVTILAGYGEASGRPPNGTRVSLEGESVASIVLRTCAPARLERFEQAGAPIAQIARDLGLRAAVGAPIVVDGRLWGAAIAAWTSSGPPSTKAEARLAAFTELVATAVANAESRAELTASRARIVVAADATRRRIERDLHDGAQQRLVALALEVRAAQALMPPALVELQTELDRVADGLTGALDELREIAHGIHPAVLTDGGLRPAFKRLARRSPVAVELEVRGPARLPEPVEVAAYYVVSEALANAAKHARASLVRVTAEAEDRVLRVTVIDNGLGGADPSLGSGLVGLKDRAEAMGGWISFASARGEGTTLRVELPLGDAGIAPASASGEAGIAPTRGPAAPTRLDSAD